MGPKRDWVLYMDRLLEQEHVDVAVGGDCSHWAHVLDLLCLDHIEVIHSE